MCINLCQNIPILVKIRQEFQALFMKTCVHLWYLVILVFIIKADCVLCDVQSETEEAVDSLLW